MTVYSYRPQLLTNKQTRNHLVIVTFFYLLRLLKYSLREARKIATCIMRKVLSHICKKLKL